MSSFEETTPPPAPAVPGVSGPRVSDDQIGSLRWRGFSRDVVVDGVEGTASITFMFYLAEATDRIWGARPVERCRTRYLIVAPRDRDGTVLYDNVLEAEFTNFQRAATADDVDMACDGVDPESLDWDGQPGSEDPCEPRVYDFGAEYTAMYCLAHGYPQLAYRNLSAQAAKKWFACAKSQKWVFLLDHPPRPPQLTDLSGLNYALTVTGELPDSARDTSMTPQVWRYHGAGRLTRVVLRPVPDLAPVRFSDDRNWVERWWHAVSREADGAELEYLRVSAITIVAP